MKHEKKTMKEAKHTPFPWIKGFSKGVGELDPSHNADENGGYMIAKTLGTDAKANLDLIWKSVHSRPKMKELLEAAKDARAVLQISAHGRGFDSRQAATHKRLEQAIKKAEAALK